MLKRRIFALILCFALAVSLPAFAAADAQGLENYSSFVLDEQSGEWSVSDPLFESMLASVAAGDAKGDMADGFIVMQARMSGNMLTDTLRPEIEMYFAARRPIGVEAVTVHIGGERIDFAAKGEITQIGSYTAERIILPLVGVDASEIFGAEQIEICLHGAGGVYRTKMDANAYESGSMKCFSLASDPVFSGLASAPQSVVLAEWERILGFAPANVRISGSELSAFGAQEYTAAVPAYEGLDLIAMEDRGDGYEALVAMLSQRGFYFGSAEKEFGPRTRDAVLRAQAHYGLAETGSADAALISCLESGIGISPVYAEEENAAVIALGDEIGIECGEWWTAKKVVAPADQQGASAQTVADGDNEFVVLSGSIANGTAGEIGLGWEVSAELIVDGKYVYECTLRVLSDGDTVFSGTMLPGAEKDMIVLAETPEGVLDGAQSAKIVFTSGDNSAECSLIG